MVVKRVFVTMYCHGRKVTALCWAKQVGKHFEVSPEVFNQISAKVNARRGDTITMGKHGRTVSEVRTAVPQGPLLPAPRWQARPHNRGAGQVRAALPLRSGHDGHELAGWYDDIQKIDSKWQVVRVYSDGSESGWRYDRASDPGRCTASNTGEPRNLVVGSNWTLRAMWYRVRCEVKDFINNFPADAFSCGYV